MISTSYTVDNTDWLKTAAIFLVSIDHFGYFFIEDADWWSVIGRLAAPPFFFLIGYAKTRVVPLHWLWLGIILTLLDSWNTDWTWVAPNILLSFALIRLARPKVQLFLQDHGWTAFVILIGVLLAVQPFAATIVDYGATGWLWALVGLCQRIYVERRAVAVMVGTSQNSSTPAQAVSEQMELKRLLACIVAMVIYLWQEQIEFKFSEVQFGAVFIGIGLLSIILCLFQRGSSRIQPPHGINDVLHFMGRHTLEIYAIQLAGSEVLIGLVPELAG
jgi:hypothetical protein